MKLFNPHLLHTKSYRQEKNSKNDEDVIEWHKSDSNNMSLLQDPHDKQNCCNDHDQSRNLVETRNLLKFHIPTDDPKSKQHQKYRKHLGIKI